MSFTTLYQLFDSVHRFNLCRKNAKETTELCQKIKKLYATYLREAPPEFDEIASNALNAYWYIDVTANKGFFMALTYKLHDLPRKYSIFYLIINIFTLITSNYCFFTIDIF